MASLPRGSYLDPALVQLNFQAPSLPRLSLKTGASGDLTHSFSSSPATPCSDGHRDAEALPTASNMGLGVLDDTVLDHVPGTTRYYDDPNRPQTADTVDARGLKCDTSGPVPIILVPQPSDDPNDPLNWPLWQRDLITFILSITAIFATCLGPILAANTLTLSIYFSLNFTYIALLTGYFLLGVGVAGFICVPSGRIWGKRHLFILGTCILIATSAWAGAVGKNYTSLVWARIFQGVGCAPFESLVTAAIGDLYFVHERGTRMAFTNLAVFGGSFFTPILVGKITHTIKWWWTFNLVAIFCSVCLIAVVLWVPETAYRRDASLNTDTALHQSSDNEPNKEVASHNFEVRGRGPIPPKKTFLQSLALFDGRKTDEFFPLLLLRPLPLLLQPAFLWACLIQGAMIGWTVFIGVILAALFLGPPLFWTEVPTGYAYTGPFVGAVLGFIISGALSDWSAKYMTKLNGGVYEPEFRIVLIIPQLIFGVMGLIGFGQTAQMTLESQIHWVVPIVFFGFEVCGMIIGATASALYIVDAYRHQAVEGFTLLLVFKNMFSFALTFKAYDWLIAGGVVPVFNILGIVQTIICLTSIPMYIYGKRLRSYFYRNDLIKKARLN